MDEYTGKYTVRSDKSLFMQLTGFSALMDDSAYTYQWNQAQGYDYWYISGDRLHFDGDAYVRVK